MDSIIIRDDNARQALIQAKEITGYEYGDNGDYSVGALITAIEDLVMKYKDLEIEFDDYKQEHPQWARADEIGVAGKRGY